MKMYVIGQAVYLYLGQLALGIRSAPDLIHIQGLPFPPNYATGSGRSTTDQLDDGARAESYSHCQPTPDSVDCQDSRQSQTELHYLNILKDAVDDTASNQHHGNTSIASISPRQEDTLASQIRLLQRPLQLDDFNREFLTKKGVFDLPPQHYL